MELQDRFRGCLLGGAAGDALGYAVEFTKNDAIRRRYGPNGITRYKLTHGKAQISDDTQMTLFTANGLLSAAAHGRKESYPCYIHRAYLDWLRTQYGGKIETGKNESVQSWLLSVPELNDPRAPGNTCLSALHSGKAGNIEAPINNSKGCGGVMRVAPIGLYFRAAHGLTAAEIDRVGAQAAAITHGHPLGWLPAAVLVRIIHEIVYGEARSLRQIVCDSLDAVCAEFPDAQKLETLRELTLRAVELSAQGLDDVDAIGELGEGWVAEETLAIAVYCALKYENDFEHALIASVNHDGDSDSTGAVAGNILGAWLGVQGIPQYYLDTLELREVITMMADDLCSDLPQTDNLSREEPEWYAKYVLNHYRL